MIDPGLKWSMTEFGEEAEFGRLRLTVGPNPLQPRFMQCWAAVSRRGRILHQAEGIRDIEAAKRWATEKALSTPTT